MSYDLVGHRLPPGASPEDGEERAIPLSPDEQERLAGALHAVDPSAERIDGDDFIELFTDAVQVFVERPGVTINVPYHGSDPSPMNRAFEYAAVVTAHGLTVWDPQADAVVEGDDASARRANDRFAATSQLVDQLGDTPTPRWKFWKR